MIVWFYEVGQTMQRYFDHKKEKDVLQHPFKREAWKHFDRTCPDFAMEPRNIQLDFCYNGFNLFNQLVALYLC